MRRPQALLVVVVLAALMPGCARDEVPQDYGVLDRPSINGFRVLHRTLDDTFSIKDASRLDERLDAADFLIHTSGWSGLPYEPAATWIRTWLEERPARQVLLVLRDRSVTNYCGRLWYEETEQELAKASSDRQRKQIAARRDYFNTMRNANDVGTGVGWQHAGALGLSILGYQDGVSPDAPSSTNGFRPIDRVPPMMSLNTSLGGDAAEPLLAIGGRTYLATYWFGESRLVVAANATPLFDASLVDHNARLLLYSIIEYLKDFPCEDVHWVEEAHVRDERPARPGMLGSLMFKSPVNYVFLHFMAAALLFIWMRLRFFGTLRSLKEDYPEKFSRHVDALAEHLAVAKADEVAQCAILNFTTGRPREVTPPDDVQRGNHD